MIKQRIHTILILLVILAFTNCSRPRKQPSAPKDTAYKREQLLETNRVLVKKDQQKIKGFIERQGWNMNETETGLWFEIVKAGSGDSIKAGMLVNFNYKISLLDGTECYNSKSDGIKSFTVGKGNVEAGLEQGILLLTEGAKARFIMSPYLAHGLIGDGDRIPARAIIIYEIELIPSIKK